jgi:hypothetical protein
MKKLFNKLLLFLIPALFLFFAIIILPPSKSFQKSLFYSLIDKNKLLQNTPSPRIIFIGGSNLSFGLNCQMIKDSLQLNPINMGIHVGLGLKYMLSDVENFIKENDIIVVSPEYQQFYGDVANGEVELLSIIVDVSPNSIKLLDFKQYYSLIQDLPIYLKSKCNGLLNKSGLDTIIGIYDRKAFNAYGDAYLHWKLTREKVSPFGKMEGKINEDVFKSLNNFRIIVNERKANLYITFPCYQDQSFINTEIQIKEVERNLKRNGFYLLSNPERYAIADSLVFNTPYHLTKKGVDLRTSLLIADLKRCLRGIILKP